MVTRDYFIIFLEPALTAHGASFLIPAKQGIRNERKTGNYCVRCDACTVDRWLWKRLQDLSRTKILHHISEARRTPRVVYDLQDRFQKTFAIYVTPDGLNGWRRSTKERSLEAFGPPIYFRPRISNGRFHFITQGIAPPSVVSDRRAPINFYDSNQD